MEEWVTVSEAARRHGVSRATIGNWMKAGRCQHRQDNRGNPQVLAPAKVTPGVPVVTGETLSAMPSPPALSVPTVEPAVDAGTQVAIAALERVVDQLRTDLHRERVVHRREVEVMQIELARPLSWGERITGRREARVLG